MEQRIIGRLGPSVSALGLGCMSIGIADVYTSSVREERAAVALIHRALDSGITLLDTADIYGVSEIRVGKALRGRRGGVTLATKFGFVSTLEYKVVAVSHFGTCAPADIHVLSRSTLVAKG